MNYYAEGGQAHGLKALAQELPKYGRMGDTMVAHINPQEAALLKSMGGSGTINPTTGLPEFGMFGIGGGGGFLGTGINKNASDPISNAASNNPISKAVSSGVQSAAGAIDSGLVSLDKAVGKAIPGGWGTVGMVAASMIPGMTPLMMGGLGALNGSGVLRKGGSFNLQGAVMGGAMAYGAASLASGLEAAGGGGSEAVGGAAGGTTPGAATAEGIAGQIANQTGSAVSAAPGSQAAMLAEQAAGMGSAGAQNISSALTAPTTGTGIGSQIMAGNFGNAASQIGQNISGAANNAYTSAGNFLDKATAPETYSNFAKGYGENVSAAGRGIANLTGLGEGTAAEAAKAFGSTGATMSNTIVPIAIGGMGLQSIEDQRNALEEQKTAGAISDADYQSQLAEIDRQAGVARASVAGSPFSTNPDRNTSIGDTYYSRGNAKDTLYTQNPAASSATLYARGGAVDNEMGFDDSPRGLGLGNMSNGFMNGGSTPTFAKGGQAKEKRDYLDMVDAELRMAPAQYVEGMGFVTPPPSVGGRLGANFDALGGNIRAGLSGNATMMQDKKILARPEMVDVGYKGQVGPGELDIGLQRALQSMPGRPKDYAINAKYSMNFANGGDVPNEPRFLSGGGDGMSDDIPATIEGKQEARLADGEFVVPADVVSHLGNGSSKAGAKQLYAMMDKIRHARTGNKKQGKEINPNKFLAA